MEDVLVFLAWVCVDVLLASLGRVAVFAVSLGRWRGERVRENEGRIYGAAGALSFVHEGQRVVTRMGLAFAGLVLCLLLGAVALALTSR
jgi:hypothetical protein